ncbi:peptide deformylase [Kineococcus xinjiangensis]|uniref:Peptide deformylase n=1 Tax=Kineococcus xinjiangensis TaxID=512762 RepID=A0A2S6ITU5_9ACTN|nr:peptide deformylase [Kineococcus xinjiangensis]PPK97600.1 peptide deformylase [Kineococcus xinjiangensis]
MSESGTARPVVQHGHPALHAPCAEVTEFGAPLHALVADLFASMAAAGGIGLAANQIGVDARVFVVDCPDERGRRVRAHVVNPRLTFPGPRNAVRAAEVCLSLTGASGVVERNASARVTGSDADGRPVSIAGHGLLARCLQHEVDHLDGLLHVDRLGPVERRAVLRQAGPRDEGHDLPGS